LARSPIASCEALHRRLCDAVSQPGGNCPVETSVDMALIGRYYERFADHAVSVARRPEFTVTGKFAGWRPDAGRLWL
jgi:phosphate transport system protein